MARNDERWRRWQLEVVKLLQAEFEEYALHIVAGDVNWALIEPCYLRRSSPRDAVAWALAATDGLPLREAILLPRRAYGLCPPAAADQPADLGRDWCCGPC